MTKSLKMTLNIPNLDVNIKLSIERSSCVSFTFHLHWAE